MSFLSLITKSQPLGWICEIFNHHWRVCATIGGDGDGDRHSTRYIPYSLKEAQHLVPLKSVCLWSVWKSGLMIDFVHSDVRVKFTMIGLESANQLSSTKARQEEGALYWRPFRRVIEVASPRR